MNTLNDKFFRVKSLQEANEQIKGRPLLRIEGLICYNYVNLFNTH